MKKLDCCGDFCPIPLIKIKKELKTLKSDDSLMIVTDHSCVAESINEFFQQHTFKYEEEEVINGVWEITITKI
ncbi:sulfurtransferase TusA family protein [Oceanirhabdus sp. W0125-5]|uniref:sulfurtransferase TusA family protein n=1 Tax=Oceanirhabdus sp. W0125-5 TaxID=2999116 RepID=UPI0022F31CC8|nr:sulfurtransferase TusA family protein [Oceanirhabdus sp. W0125-5]WBW98867.1 sulfurtransferase TusA family protein [Oceanirhabdus sp. W0125-5]